ncbi:MAG: HAD family phosphatase [Olsenella sp.]|nr:HAD family phosphatase [Olsenella sp.]
MTVYQFVRVTRHRKLTHIANGRRVVLPSHPTGLWPPRFKAAIFDFDGTISDTAALWREVDEAFLGRRGLSVPPDYPRMLSILGFRAGAQYTIETFGLNETVQDICEEWSRMGRALYETRATLRPGAEAYLRALRDLGVPTALATTNDPEVLDAMRGVEVDELFDVRVHGREVRHAKDHPDIYLEAASRLGARPTECIVFEDISVGLRSARTAGMITCAVQSNDPIQNVDEVREAADLFLRDWRDLGL